MHHKQKFSTVQHHSRVGLLTGLLLLVISLPAVDQPVPFQGRLKAVDGLHIDDPDATFSVALYAVASGGEALWRHDFNGVVVDRGLFRLELPLPAEVLATESPRYLGISYDGGDELPRTRLLAVPYARVADQSRAASGALRGELDDLQAAVDDLSTGAAAGVNVKRYGARGNNQSNPLTAEEAAAINARADIGAEAGDEADWAGIQLALIAHGRVYLPRGTYRINKTIDLTHPWVGEGALMAGAGAKATTIIGRTTGMTMVELGSYNVLCDLALNGGWDAFKAKWGVYVGPGQRGQLYRCYVRYFSDAALVLDGTQNSCYVDNFFGDAKYCIRLMNGVRNTTFYNCNTAQWSMTQFINDPANNDEPPWQAADQRFLYIGRGYRSDGYPAGMDEDRLVASSNHGNSNLSFYGGIFEHISGADYGMELADYCAERITFHGCELHGGRRGMAWWPEAQAPYPAQGHGNVRLTIDSCTILKLNTAQTGGPTPVVRGAYPVHFANNYYPKRGSPVLFEAIEGAAYARVTADADTRNALGETETSFQAGIGNWMADGSQASVAWDPALRALHLQSSYIGNGAKISPAVKKDAGTLWLFRIVIAEVSNDGDGTLRLLTKYQDPADGKWKTHLVADGLGPGLHEIPYICHGDEAGIALYPGENLTTSARIKYFACTLPGDL